MKIDPKNINLREINIKKSWVVFGLVFLFIFITGTLLYKGQKIKIILEKTEYTGGEEIRLKIKNYFLNEEICLSSCYPYLLQKESSGIKTGWNVYSYEECTFQDRITTCINPGEIRAFATSLPELKEGTYRIAVPVCKDCNLGTDFRENARFYSASFKIK